MKKQYLFVCTLLLVLLSIGNSFGQSNVTGVYSSLSYSEQSGDVLGQELFVIYSRDGYYVVYQYSAGPPSIPVVVKADVRDGKIEFTLPKTSYGFYGKFVGKIIETEIVGEYEHGYSNSNGEKKFVYPKKKSYWQ